jgi:hypothetical protein
MLVFVLSMTVPAAAQHDHHDASSGVMISHDAPDSGREYVGGLSHFGILYLGSDLAPDYHQQNHVRVQENGVVLMETTPDSGHDYDGVYLFDVAFPVLGNYTVEALGDGGNVLASFSGFVVDPAAAGPAPQATLKLDAPASATAGVAAPFTFETDGADGALVKHSDAWFEVRQGADLVFRTKTHSHEGAQRVFYAFALPGTYTVRVTSFLAFPSGGAPLFAPQVAERQVMVLPGTVQGATVNAQVPAAPDPPLTNNVITVPGDAGHSLLGTYDPWTTVGPFTQMHLTALAMDPATRMPVPHVDFAATLRDEAGRTLFASDTLHEYDGIYEFTAVEPVGHYVLSVDAKQDTWSSHMEMPYTVLPPVMAVAVGSVGVPPAASAALGPVLYTVSGLDGIVAGRPANLTFQSRTLAGQPFPHSEFDYQVLGANKVPLLAGKLHTHGDGAFQLTASLPEGAYTLRISPFPLEPQPAPVFFGKSVGDPLDLPFTVASGPGFPVPAVLPGSGSLPASHTAPGAGLLLVAALAGCAMAARRLRLG